MSQKLSALLGGGSGGHYIAEPVTTYSSVEYMAEKGYLPMEGGVLAQSEYPELFAQFGHEHLGVATQITGPNWPAGESNMTPIWDVDGHPDRLAIVTTNSGNYWAVYDKATNLRINRGYASSSSNRVTMMSLQNSALYVGFTDGSFLRVYNDAYSQQTTVSAVTLGVPIGTTSSLDIVGFMEHDGWLYVALNRLGIIRARLDSVLTQASSWTIVYNTSVGATASMINERTRNGFVAINGTLFLTMQSNLFRSGDGGASWTRVASSFNNMSPPVMWNDALWTFYYATPTGSAQAPHTPSNTQVLKSTDDGITWGVAMYTSNLSNRLKPFVMNGMLIIAGLPAIGSQQYYRAIFKELPGATLYPEAIGNDDYIINIGPFRSSFQHSVFYNGMIREYTGSPHSTGVMCYDHILTHDPSTHFKLPSAVTHPRTYIKAR